MSFIERFSSLQRLKCTRTIEKGPQSVLSLEVKCTSIIEKVLLYYRPVTSGLTTSL